MRYHVEPANRGMAPMRLPQDVIRCLIERLKSRAFMEGLGIYFFPASSEG